MLLSVLFVLCIFALVWLLLPRIAEGIGATAEVFADRMRWYGVHRTATEIRRWMLAGMAVAAGLAFVLFGGCLFPLGAVFLVWKAPYWILLAIQARRRQQFQKQFVDVLVMMSNSMRAGFNLPQTLQIVATEMPSPSRDEFALALRDRHLGNSMEAALEGLARRMRSDSVTIFVTSVLVTMQTGGDLSRVLDKLTTAIRDRERAEDRIHTMTSEGRMQGYIISVIPLLMFACVYVFSPDSVRALLRRPWGTIVIGMGLVFNFLGLVAMQNMSKVKV
jgi:tight adherence protein B